jgi:hypothetical protein
MKTDQAIDEFLATGPAAFRALTAGFTRFQGLPWESGA